MNIDIDPTKHKGALQSEAFAGITVDDDLAGHASAGRRICGTSSGRIRVSDRVQ